jgi:hypothetical protein
LISGTKVGERGRKVGNDKAIIIIIGFIIPFKFQVGERRWENIYFLNVTKCRVCKSKNSERGRKRGGPLWWFA